MMTPTAACLHASVASHGLEPADPSKLLASVLAEEQEMGWCRDCCQYVHRELGAPAWKRRFGYETGAWRWRPYGIGRAGLTPRRSSRGYASLGTSSPPGLDVAAARLGCFRSSPRFGAVDTLRCASNGDARRLSTPTATVQPGASPGRVRARR